MSFVATAVTVFKVALVVYSVVTAQKAADEVKKRKQEAEAAAKAQEEAAKGQQLVVEGAPGTLGIPYGRNLIGGSQVYLKTLSNYVYAGAASGGQVFTAGGDDATAANRSGTKNEYLVTQQALCFAGINSVQEILIDDRRIGGEYINGNDEVVTSTTPGATFAAPLKGSTRVYIYPDGNVADPLAIANDAGRASAVFTDAAYATCVYHLNRDDPQFSGVPTAQFLVEGMRVATIEGSLGARTLSGTKVYSNNPALCILDYLTNNKYGLGLSASSLDLDSFHAAYLICEKVVKSNVPRAGAFWEAHGGIRDIKLYECNVTLDSSKTLRDNLTTLLETMNDANLIWSGGKYKLTLAYPFIYDNTTAYTVGAIVQEGNASAARLYRCVANTTGVLPSTDLLHTKWADDVDAYITDSHIVRESDISLSWPNAQTRLNFATVKYLNESKDFKEDTATWPVKTESLYAAFLTQDSGLLLETEQFATGVTSYYTALAKAEYLVRASRSQVTYEFSVCSEFFYLEPGDIVYIKSDVLGIPGDLIKLTEVRPEDNAIKIAATRFDANVLSWNVEDNEPAAVRRIFNSALGQASNLSFMQAGATLQGSAGVLTWSNASDSRVFMYSVRMSTGAINANTVWSELATVRQKTNSTVTTFELPPIVAAAYNVAVVASTGGAIAARDGWPTLSIVAGQISADTAATVRVRCYKRSATLPSAPSGGVFNFAAHTITELSGGWDAVPAAGSDPVYASDAVATSPNGRGIDSSLVWSAPVLLLSGTVSATLSKASVGVTQNVDTTLSYTSATGNMSVFNGTIDVTADSSFAVESQTDCVVLILTAAGPGIGEYHVTSLTADTASAVLTATYNGHTVRKTLTVSLIGPGYVRDTTAPPPPTGLSVTTTSTVVLISQIAPTYTAGRGHHYTEIYSKAGDAVDSSGATKLDEFQGNFYTLPSTPGSTSSLYFKWISRDKGASALSTKYLINPALLAGGQLAAGAVGASNIADSAITSAKLAIDSVTSAKVADNAISAAKVAMSAITTAKLADGAVVSDKIAANSVSADKVAANAITADKILAGSIVADKLAVDAVTANSIEAGAIIATKIATDAVTADKIFAGSIGADKLAVDAVTANSIKAGAVTALKVATNAINAEHISSGAITTSKLLVTGGGAALNDDPYTLDVDAWSFANAIQIVDATCPAGRYALETSTNTWGASRKVQIDPARNYQYRFWIKKTAGTALTYGMVQFFDDAGATVFNAGGTWAAEGSYNYFGLINQDAPTAWTEYVISFGPNEVAKIPAGAKQMSVGAIVNYTGSTAATTRIAGMRVFEKASGDMIVDGAITAGKIAVGAITAGSGIIADLAITTAKIANTLQSTNYAAGSAGWKIEKSGNMELNNAIFRGEIDVVTPGAGSNARLVIKNNVIKVYDATNQVRVIIGDLTA